MVLSEGTRNHWPCLCGDIDTGVIVNMLGLRGSPSAVLSGRVYFYLGMWPTLNLLPVAFRFHLPDGKCGLNLIFGIPEKFSCFNCQVEAFIVINLFTRY